MNWVEIIELRSYSFKRETLKELKHAISEEEQTEGLRAFEIYHNASVSTDTSIHIHWITNDDQVSKSSLGLRIALSLKEFGRVNHTIWLKE